MVTVDMTPVRRQISRRMRRMRRTTARRMRRAATAQQADFKRAETARRRRARAVAKWAAIEAETGQTEKVTESKTKTDTTASTTETKVAAKREEQRNFRVRFAPDVLVAQIPSDAEASLPPPVAAPVGVALRPTEESSSVSDAMRAARLILRVRRKSNRSIFDINGANEVTADGEKTPLDIVDRKPASTKLGPPTSNMLDILGEIFCDEDDELDPEYTPDEHNIAEDSGDPDDDSDASVDPVNHNMTQSESPKSRRIVPMRLSISSSASRTDLARSWKRPRPRESDIDFDEPNAIQESSSQDAYVNGTTELPACDNFDGFLSARKKKRRKISDIESISLLQNGNGSSPVSESAVLNKDNKTKSLFTLSKTSYTGANGQANIGKSESNDCIRKDATESDGQAVETVEEMSGLKDGDLKAAGDGSVQGIDKSGDDDIEKIFGSMKKKATSPSAEKRGVKSETSPKKHKRSHKHNDTLNQTTGPRRYTEEGFRVMSVDEIAADQPAGLNGSCPFDCSCCY